MYHENYFPGDTYENDITRSAFELSAYLIAGLLFSKIGPQKFFFYTYFLGALGGLGVLIVDENEMKEVEMLCSFVAIFGISATYQAIYLNNDLFPIIFASTTFGVCNIFSGIANAISIEII